VVVPFAAGAKEHGRHLPLNTDQRVMEFLLEAAIEEADALIAPPILHGWFPAFREFPGTEIADVGVFIDYVRAVAQSLVRQGAQRLVFLNLGIERATGLPLAIVARDIRADDKTLTLLVNWDDLETEAIAEFTEQIRGGHADEIETSIVLALDAAAVRQDQASVDYRADRSPLIGYAPGKFEAHESGAFGDPTLATAAKGHKALAIMRARWLEALAAFAEVE
jgi:creatinine amidohydrolase